MTFLKKQWQKLYRRLQASAREIRRLERQDAPQKQPVKARHTLTVAAGFTVLTLAALGVVFGAVLLREAVLSDRQARYDRQAEEYARLVAPVVQFDAGDFISPDHADNLSLLIPAYWQAQAQISGASDVTATDPAAETVTEQAVQQAARALFGREVICQTFSLDGLIFEFVENGRYYLSPITVPIAMYTPRVTQITDADAGAELTVDFVEIGPARRVAKTARITLSDENGRRVITSVVTES